MPSAAQLSPASDASPSESTIHVGRVGATLGKATWLIVEVVVIPSVLLYVLVQAGHPMLGLAVVFGWRAGCILTRWARGVRVPATVWVAFGIFAARTGLSLAISSVALYLWQPVIMTALMGLGFIATAFTAKPLIMRLAHDFVHLPDRVVADPRVRRTFRDLTLIWGGVHVVSAGVCAWAMRYSTGTTVAVHGLVGVLCLLIAVSGAVGWGLWRVSRIPGLRIRRGDPPKCPLTARVAREPGSVRTAA